MSNINSLLARQPNPALAAAERILKGLLKLYEDPTRWTQGAFYRDMDGVGCPSISMYSCCLSGGTTVSKHNNPSCPGDYSPATIARFAMMDANGTPGGIAEWNDEPGRTIEEVRQFIQKGIDHIDTFAVSHE